jgi:hypothetical protein
VVPSLGGTTWDRTCQRSRPTTVRSRSSHSVAGSMPACEEICLMAPPNTFVSGARITAVDGCETRALRVDARRNRDRVLDRSCFAEP